MEPYAAHYETLRELETRHEELLDQLDALDKRVEETLKAWQGCRQAPRPKA